MTREADPPYEAKLPWRMEIIDRYEGGGPCYLIIDADGEWIMSDQTYYPTAPSREIAEWLMRLANGAALLAVAGE